MTRKAHKETEVVDKQRLRTFVLGGAVGALVGILLAPRSGKELRGSLANRAGEARERGRERYFGAQEQMRDRLAASRKGSRKPRPDVANLGGSPPPEEEIETPMPRLRDVSKDVVGGVEEAADVERSEDLRRKVRETRERLRGRDEPGRER
jgi:gas vesicle protein